MKYVLTKTLKTLNTLHPLRPENSKNLFLRCLRMSVGATFFALRKGRAIVPYYVGKATKDFYSEVLEPHKLNKYNDVLQAHVIGTPVFFFIVHPLQKGRTASAVIDKIETYLIQSALRVNPELRNIQKTNLPTWTIRNVTNRKPGKTRKEEKAFIGMMKFQKPTLQY